MSLTFDDAELEEYFRLVQAADEYLNRLIRQKRATEYLAFKAANSFP